MRKIPVHPPDTDAWRQWIKDCEDATQANIEAVQRGDSISITDLYKRDIIKKTYFFSRGAPFYGKCAYCECSLHSQYGDVEHFRPKAGVTDENDQPILLKDAQGNVVIGANGEAKRHPGYYWLAYDWHNLIPACIKCNQRSKEGDILLGKHTRFPVVGFHAQKPGDEIHEKPLLINPASGHATDDPEKHLFIEPKTGVMQAQSDEGEMCIQIFGLNRPDLITARKRAPDRPNLLIIKLQKAASQRFDPQEDQLEILHELLQLLDELVGILQGKEPYTMAAKKVLEEKGFSLKWLEQRRRDCQGALSKVKFGGAIAPE